jgi:ATP-dependent RNA helicase UAP56/SUB2
LKTEVFYGGYPYTENVKILKGKSPPHIIIGTPGRILALV